MYDIHLTSKNEGVVTFKEFQEKFIEICKSHKDQDRALCFAFILYCQRDPQIPEILCNSNYWNALDEISGKYITVFSIKTIFEESPIYNMVSVSSVMKPNNASNQILEKYFNLNVEVLYPSILFFQVIEDKILNPFLVPLNETKKEESFMEIKKLWK